MEDYLPNAVEAGRYKAQKEATHRSSKLAVHVEGEVIPVVEFYDTGFAVQSQYRLPNRAHVEVFDGAKSLYLGMIHYSVVDNQLQRFEFKRLNPATGQMPKDYADENMPIAGLISKS